MSVRFAPTNIQGDYDNLRRALERLLDDAVKSSNGPMVDHAGHCLNNLNDLRNSLEERFGETATWRRIDRDPLEEGEPWTFVTLAPYYEDK